MVAGMNAVLELLKKPTPLMLALRELEEAKREHLNACTAVEYSIAMRDYNAARIARLEELITNQV